MGMSEKFVYDSTGNIIQLDDIVLEYSHGDRLQRRGNMQYLYDGNGRLVKKSDCRCMAKSKNDGNSTPTTRQ